jgi:hypothetical protein
MSTSPFNSIIADFREAWEKARPEPTLYWYERSGWDHELQAMFKRRHLWIVGQMCIPRPTNPENVMDPWGYLLLPDDDDVRPASSELLSVAAQAGAALPSGIRAGLEPYCPSMVHDAASWWFAFLWSHYGESPWESAGHFQEELTLTHPFLHSINAIEIYILNAEVAGTAQQGDGKADAEEHSVPGSPSNGRAIGTRHTSSLPQLGRHDRQAYQLSLTGRKQQEIADLLNKENGTTYAQGQVSRMIGRAKRHAKASGLDDLIPAPAKPEIAVAPERLELGPRADHRTSRQRPQSNPDAD